MNLGRALALALALLGARSVHAQVAYQGQPVDIYTGVVNAPASILAQGGAFIGVAEGAAGMKVNPASVANRFAYFTDEFWDWDWNVDFTILGVADLGQQDFFNSSRTRLDVEQFQKANIALDFQIGRFGFGISFDSTEIRECDSGEADCLTLDTQARGTITWVNTGRLGAGYAFLDGDLILGGNLLVPTISFSINGDDSASPGVIGSTVELGALWRPAGENLRVGVTWRSRTRANIDVDEARFPDRRIAGREVPPALVVPGRLGIGVAYAFGSRPMNLRPSFGDEDVDADDYESYPRGHYQASADLVLVGSDSDTVGLDGWFEQEAQPVGRDPVLAIHLGVQGEVIEDFMVARLGWVWRAGAAFDIARNFNQLTLSGGFWY